MIMLHKRKHQGGKSKKNTNLNAADSDEEAIMV